MLNPAKIQVTAVFIDGLRMRIRPQPNLNHEEIGYVYNGDVLAVFSAPVNGFYKLVDGCGFVMIKFPGATWKTQIQGS